MNVALNTFQLSNVYNDSVNPLAPLLPVLNNEVQNEMVLNTRKRFAKELKHDIQRKRFSYIPITVNDKENVDQYIFKVNVLESIPMIQANLNIPDIQQNVIGPILEQLVVIQQQIAANQAATQHALEGLITKSSNATADSVNDIVAPPRNGLLPPPVNFPTTVQEILNINNGNLLNNIENYYGFDHNGSLINRRKRIKRAYGIGQIMNISIV